MDSWSRFRRESAFWHSVAVRSLSEPVQPSNFAELCNPDTRARNRAEEAILKRETSIEKDLKCSLVRQDVDWKACPNLRVDRAIECTFAPDVANDLSELYACLSTLGFSSTVMCCIGTCLTSRPLPSVYSLDVRFSFREFEYHIMWARAEELFTILAKSWNSPAREPSRPLRPGESTPGLFRSLEAQLSSSMLPIRPPCRFVVQGSCSPGRATALRNSSDVDLVFFLESEPIRQMLPSKVEVLHGFICLGHQHLSQAARSAHALAAGVLFQYYLRHGTDGQGNGIRVSYKGIDFDVVLGLEGLHTEDVARVVNVVEQQIQSSDSFEHFERLHLLRPTFIAARCGGHELQPAIALAVRILKIWRQIVSAWIFDSDAMRMNGTSSDELIFEPGAPRQGGLSKSLKGYLTSDFEFVVRQCALLLPRGSPDDLIVSAWKRLADGWTPRMDACGFTTPLDTRRLHLIMREQLAAKVTLSCHHGSIATTLICIAHLKALDYVAAERSIIFERMYHHETGMLLSFDGSFRFGIQDMYDQIQGVDRAPKKHKLPLTIKYFVADPSLACFYPDAQRIVRDMQISGSRHAKPINGFKLRRQRFQSLCEETGFQGLAVGLWWLMVLQLEPLEQLRYYGGHAFRGHTPWCLFDYEEYLSIIFGGMQVDLEERAKAEQMLTSSHFEEIALAGEEAFEEASFKPSFGLMTKAILLTVSRNSSRE